MSAQEEQILANLEKAERHSFQGRHEQALYELQPAIGAIHTSLETISLSTIVDAYLLAMRTYIGLERMDELFRYYHLLIAASDNSNDHNQLAKIHRTIGAMWRNIGLHFNALEDFDLALRFAEELDDGETAAIHTEIGYTLSELGEFEKAETHLNTAITLFQNLKDKRDILNLCTALNNRGLNNEFRGEHTKALEDYNSSLQIARAVENIEKEERALVNRARLLARIGESDSAMKDMEQAFELDKTTRKEDLMGGALLVKALLYLSNGEMKKAEDTYNKADEAFSNNLSTIHGGMVAFLWGSALMDIGLVEDAAKNLNRAILLFEDAGSENFIQMAEEMLTLCKQGA